MLNVHFGHRLEKKAAEAKKTKSTLADKLKRIAQLKKDVKAKDK
jgi:hypothetical protein